MSIFCICGFSGAGKTTVAKKVSEMLGIHRELTCTTRPMRFNETDGVDYHFLKNDTFEYLKKTNKLIAVEEFNVVDNQTFKYGINKNDIDAHNNIVIVVNPTGVVDLKEKYDNVYSILIDIDDDERIRRIVSRDDSQKPEEIKRRTNADRKTFNNFEFDFTVANYDLDKCLHEIAKIITQRMEK